QLHGGEVGLAAPQARRDGPYRFGVDGGADEEAARAPQCRAPEGVEQAGAPRAGDGDAEVGFAVGARAGVPVPGGVQSDQGAAGEGQRDEAGPFEQARRRSLVGGEAGGEGAAAAAADGQFGAGEGVGGDGEEGEAGRRSEERRVGKECRAGGASEREREEKEAREG